MMPKLQNILDSFLALLHSLNDMVINDLIAIDGENECLVCLCVMVIASAMIELMNNLMMKTKNSE